MLRKLGKYVSSFEKFKFKNQLKSSPRGEHELNLSVSQPIIKIKCIFYLFLLQLIINQCIYLCFLLKYNNFLDILPFSINSSNCQQPIQHFKEQTKNPLQFVGD